MKDLQVMLNVMWLGETAASHWQVVGSNRLQVPGESTSEAFQMD